jgi:hypothetical protein
MRGLRLLFVFLSLVLLSGCSGRLKPRGRLLVNGDPFRPGEGEIVRVALFSTEAGKDEGSHPAEYRREDGTFQVPGRGGRGVPPGKYRFTVQVLKNRKDRLKGRFGPANSPFVREVSTRSEEIILDLGKPTEGAPPVEGK